MAVVLGQHLLVLSRAKEGYVTRFIELIHGIFEGHLGSLLIVLPDPWRPILEVGREDGLGDVDHEEGSVAGGPAGGCP